MGEAVGFVIFGLGSFLVLGYVGVVIFRNVFFLWGRSVFGGFTWVCVDKFVWTRRKCFCENSWGVLWVEEGYV